MNTVNQNIPVRTAPPSLSDYHGDLSKFHDYGPLMIDGRPVRLFDETVEQASLPPYYVEWGREGVIATEELARYADANTPRTRYRRWSVCELPKIGMVYGMIVDGWRHWIFQHQGLWFIRRGRHVRVARKLNDIWEQFLSFPIAQSAVCAHNLEAAQRLAVFYSLTEAEKAGGIGWTTAWVVQRPS